MAARAAKPGRRGRSRRRATKPGDGQRIAIEYVAIKDLTPAAYNPRQISDVEMEKLERSLAEFGVVDPIIVRRESGEIIGGHQRVLAAEHRGLAQVPVVYLDGLSDEQARLLNLALNRISGEWDLPKLGALITELQELPDVELSLAGFDGAELSRALTAYRLSAGAGLTDDDAVPEVPEEPTTKPGDLWLLGEHRLLCGDARKAEDVEHLTRGEPIGSVITSPPYPGVGAWESIWPGLSLDQCHDWLAEGYKVWARFCGRPCNWIINTADNTTNQWNDWRTARAAERVGVRLVQRAVWYRNGWVPAGVSRKRILQVHEWVLWLTPNEEFVAPWDSVDGLVSTVFMQPWDRERLHETPYPVALVGTWVTLWSKPSAPVFDPFLGSGTTMIACEKLGRRCYGMEIEPRYCDVSVERWEAYTGGKAERDGPD